jgi:tetratricopeptide (TPR) repeat protein
MTVARQQDDKRDESKASGTLGNVYGQLGNYELAYECHVRALRLAEGVGELREVCRCLGNLAWLHYEGGSDERAAQLAEKAVALARLIGDERQLGNWLMVWARALADLLNRR